MASSNQEECVVPTNEVKRFIKECMLSVGTPEKEAKDFADVLVAADYRGHYSHGLNRIDVYIEMVESGMINPAAKPMIIKETAATAFVDGQNGLGPTVGNFCMDLAIKKAKEVGIGWVVARRSNHFGIVAWYTLRALEQGLMGMGFTNSSPAMCVPRTNEVAVGTCPISLVAPAKNGDTFELDMACTAVAVGKVELQQRKGEPIPEGWALDFDGKPTTDPNVAFASHRMLPLGGSETTSGYKGYGLALMVEIFCGILADGSYGPNVPTWLSKEREANLAQCFVAIDPKCFAPNFEDRLGDMLTYLRNLEPVDPNKPVLVAGDPEKQHMKKVDELGGIKYHPNLIKVTNDIAAARGIRSMKTV